jgi:hypothetical protein
MDPSNTDYTIVQNRTLGVIQSLLVTGVKLYMQSRKLAPDRRTASDKFPGGPVVFVNSPDRLSGKLFCL